MCGGVGLSRDVQVKYKQVEGDNIEMLKVLEICLFF